MALTNGYVKFNFYLTNLHCPFCHAQLSPTSFAKYNNHKGTTVLTMSGGSYRCSACSKKVKASNIRPEINQQLRQERVRLEELRDVIFGDIL